MTKLIILDRDGVINHDSDDYIKSPEEWHPIAGSLEAIALLCQAHYKVAVFTNQSGIARKYYTEDTLQAIHKKMLSQVGAAGGQIDKIVYCPHGPNDNCACRKPKPGLLRQLEKHYHMPLIGIPLIGDTKRDLEAGIPCDAYPILVKTGYGLQALQDLPDFFKKIPCFDNLLEAAKALISGTIPRT